MSFKNGNPGNHTHATTRREEATARNEAWAGLSLKDKLAALDARLGKGVGATKQRARILAMMEAPKKPVKGQKNPRPAKTEDAKSA